METKSLETAETMTVDQFLSLEPEIQNNIVGLRGMSWNNVYGKDCFHENGYWYAENMNIGAKKDFNFVENPFTILNKIDGVFSEKVSDDPIKWKCTIKCEYNPISLVEYEHESLGLSVCVCLLIFNGFLI